MTVMQVVRTFIDICKIQGREKNYLPRKLACEETLAMCEFGENFGGGTELALVSLFAFYANRRKPFSSLIMTLHNLILSIFFARYGRGAITACNNYCEPENISALTTHER